MKHEIIEMERTERAAYEKPAVETFTEEASGIGMIKNVRREHVARVVFKTLGVGLVGSRAQEAEIGHWRKIVGAKAALDDGAVGRGGLRQDDVAHLDLGIEPTAGTHADQRLGAINVDQFVHIDRE